MIVGVWFKVTKEMITDGIAIDAHIDSMAIIDIKKLTREKSLKVLQLKRQKGYDGDDFARNTITYIYRGKAYKINRIIKYGHSYPVRKRKST